MNWSVRLYFSLLNENPNHYPASINQRPLNSEPTTIKIEIIGFPDISDFHSPTNYELSAINRRVSALSSHHHYFTTSFPCASQPNCFPASWLPGFVTFILYPFAYGCVPNTISNQYIISGNPTPPDAFQKPKTIKSVAICVDQWSIKNSIIHLIYLSVPKISQIKILHQSLHIQPHSRAPITISSSYS
jgi:hypothetical protein